MATCTYEIRGKDGGTEKITRDRHSYAWSGQHMPCTGVWKCLYCGHVASRQPHPLDYSIGCKDDED